MPEIVAHSPAVVRQARIAVKVDDVHVVYTAHEDRRPALGELFRRGFRNRGVRRVHAVRGVSLELREGESVGLIGPNGSGKSSLLRTVAGLLEPTSGSVHARGLPVLLGVSGALNKTLSARRNIYLGCTALGLSRKETANRIDEVLDFAELQEQADLPVRTFSSGMRARLQFSIAATVKPEILLIDELLGVGDAEFRAKSRDRITELADHASAVVLVSHSLSAVKEACERVVWLDAGRVVADGDPTEVIRAYRKAVRAARSDSRSPGGSSSARTDSTDALGAVTIPSH